MSYNSYDPFGVCFNVLKMRYVDYDESLTSKNLLNKFDKVNVFINLETVFKNISTVQDLEKMIIIKRDFDVLMVANILNLVAHYKRFFVNNTFDTKVYIYNTDFDSTEFNQFKYNEDFRSYYLTKYTSNPKFVLFTEHLKNSILPDVRTYCEFIPGVYYVSSKNIEGSLVPYIIGMNDLTRKNIIIGGELYDTQYSIIPNYINHYIHKSLNMNTVCSELPEYLKDISKKEDADLSQILSTYNSYATYCALMSVLGNKVRSIDGINGYGLYTLQKCINNGKIQNIIQDGTSNPELIGDIFHDEEIKKEFINNFYCSSIISMYDELSDSEKESILNQITVDRIDRNSFAQLNQTKFYDHNLILEGLLI